MCLWIKIFILTWQPSSIYAGLDSLRLMSPQQTIRGNPWCINAGQTPYDILWGDISGTTQYNMILHGIGGFSFFIPVAGDYSISVSLNVIGFGAWNNIFMYVDGTAGMGSTPNAQLSTFIPKNVLSALPTFSWAGTISAGYHTITFNGLCNNPIYSIHHAATGTLRFDSTCNVNINILRLN